MPSLDYQSEMPVSATELFNWHLRPGAFARLMPPWNPVRPLEIPEGLTDGCRAVFEISTGPVRRKWTAVHKVNPSELWFEDHQESGPFRSWIHRHSAENHTVEDNRSFLRDHIDFEMPFGLFGRLGTAFLRREMDRMFAYRHHTTCEDLRNHALFGSCPRMNIAISGASGLVGSALTGFLQTGGHQVRRLVRRAVRPGSGEIEWSPEHGLVDASQAADVDAVIHLAGANIAEGRWTESRKRDLFDSRVRGTEALARSLSEMANPPQTFISASAIGFYGDRGDEQLSEDSESGDGFLPDLCRHWEAACEPARAAGIRVANPRLGVVLSPRGGALRKMLLPFQLGGGGIVGSGRQFWSWVGLDDVIDAFHWILLRKEMAGPINVVAPASDDNRRFTKVLGSVLRRPTILPMPAAAARIALGELADGLLLASARVIPNRLSASDFQYRHGELDACLRHCLGLTK